MHTVTHTDLKQLTQTSRLPTASVVAVKLAWTFALWSQRRRTRQILRDMPMIMLDDIGLTVAEARHEARKFFWEA